MHYSRCFTRAATASLTVIPRMPRDHGVSRDVSIHAKTVIRYATRALLNERSKATAVLEVNENLSYVELPYRSA